MRSRAFRRRRRLPPAETERCRCAADIDAHFANPGEHRAATHQVWNYWHVPGSYTYLRTSPEKVIAREKVEEFVEALEDLGGGQLGLCAASPGPSSACMCRAARRRCTMIRPTGARLCLFADPQRPPDDRRRDDRRCRTATCSAPSSTERPQARDLFDLVEPRFNRLTLFDDRIPHAVPARRRPMDPIEGRFVLHGHFSEAGVGRPRRAPRPSR